MHDTRRYHRRRRPTFARSYGAIAGLLGGTTGTAAATGVADAAAAGGIGSTIASGLATAAGPALTGLGNTALGGLESIGQGLQSLFTGGGGEAGKLAALGQAVPEGVELAGPSSTFAGPGFLSSVAHGFVGGPQQFASPSAGTSLGHGVGQLLNALQQMQQQGGGPAKMPPIVTMGPPVRAPQVIASGPAQPAAAPIMSLLHI
jgi:hypothetical protein